MTRIEGEQKTKIAQEEVSSKEDDRGVGGVRVEGETMRTHDPRQPSEQERNERGMTHFPFRSWCWHCVRGRGKVEDGRKATVEERNVSEIHVSTWITRS